MTPQRHAISPATRSFNRRAIILLAALLIAAVLASTVWSQNGTPSTLGDRTDRLELKMLELVNGDRLAPSSQGETRGIAHSLQWDARLAAVARAHSEEMARRDYFSHQGLDGSEPATRVSRAGIQWRATGENIAKTSDVFEAESHFMNEPKFQRNHRGNILNPSFTHVGVGIARGPDGFFYITQEFAQLR